MTLKSNNIGVNTNNRLSVQVTLTGLSFLVTNVDTHEEVFFTEKKFSNSHTPEELLIELKAIFSQNQSLSGSFEEVSIVYSNTVYTLVPSSLFDETKLSDYLKFNSKLLANDYIAFDHIQNHDIVVVYVPYVNINNYLFDRFGSFQYFHGASILLKSVLDSDKHSKLPKAYINVVEDHFDLVILKNGSLELCNTYSFKTPEDFIYYLLFSLEQLSLNPDSLDVILIGDIEKGDSTFEILYRYIRSLRFFNSEENIEENNDAQGNHSHYLLKNIY